MYLSAETPAKRISGQLARIFLVLIIGFMLLWWQQDRLIATTAANENNDIFNNSASSQNVNNDEAGQRNTNTKAFTAIFYESDEASTPITSRWQGIDGRTGLETYVIRPGDTLWGIAVRFNLDIDTLRWANANLERNPDLLLPGNELVILPVLGVYHEVVSGDTLTSIATQYGVTEIDILEFPLNNLPSKLELKLGQKLVIPNGRKDIVQPTPQPDEAYVLAWPLVGPITQKYSEGHLAVDVGAPYGSSVYAAEAGTVVYAQWAQTGYGFTVIIEHDNNLKTLYSHLKGALVRSGAYVERGQVIGEVGSTGNSTGPHVHFEVRENGLQVNPKLYLK